MVTIRPLSRGAFETNIVQALDFDGELVVLYSKRRHIEISLRVGLADCQHIGIGHTCQMI